MSQVYFYVSSHMAIVVTKIIRPLSACVVPWMHVHECLSPCQRGEYSIVKPVYCKLSYLLQDWTLQVKQKLWASVARLKVASLQKPPLALKKGDILTAKTDNKRRFGSLLSLSNLCCAERSVSVWGAKWSHYHDDDVLSLLLPFQHGVVVKPWLVRDSCG